MKNRIFTLIENKQLTPSDFATAIGVSASTISSMKTGRTQPTLALVEKIKYTFPDVDVNWLIFGEGELKDEVDAHKEDDEIQEGLFKEENVANDYEAVYIAEQPKQLVVENKTLLGDQRKEKMTTRSIKRIVVFYTDGTFEEFDKIPI